MKNVLLFLIPTLLTIIGVLLGVFVGEAAAALFITFVVGFVVCTLLGFLLVYTFGD